MRQSAAVISRDDRSLKTLETTLGELDIEMVNCPSGQAALEMVMTGRCATLIVDFDLPGAEEIIRMATLLPPSQKPVLLAVASRAWPGTDITLQGYADVMWASDQGRAGLFFSKLTPVARKHLKQWLGKRSSQSKRKSKDPHVVRNLMPPRDAEVSYSASGLSEKSESA